MIAMPIDFHSQQNRLSYAERTADRTWRNGMQSAVQAAGMRVVDVGCGGGIYARAWAELGAAQVTGVDSSAVMVDAARECCADLANVDFQQADALATGLPDGSADLVFARALIHHLPDQSAFFHEARRMLVEGGVLLIQDRTPDDVFSPASPDHIRGYFFACFPQLVQVELARRRGVSDVSRALFASEFVDVQATTLWETRRVYDSFAELADDVRARTGRSILHELSDGQLERLIDHMRAQLPADGLIVERDRWTVWRAYAKVL